MYEFYMDGMRLPVTPSALTIKTANQNKTINLINEGQVNVLKTVCAGLRRRMGTFSPAAT